MKRLSMSSSFS